MRREKGREKDHTGEKRTEEKPADLAVRRVLGGAEEGGG